MELPPRPAPLGAVLLDQPLARAVELQPRAVDQQVHGPGVVAKRRGKTRGFASPNGSLRVRLFAWDRIAEGEQLQTRRLALKEAALPQFAWIGLVGTEVCTATHRTPMRLRMALVRGE